MRFMFIAGEWANSATQKTFDVFQFLPTVQFMFGFSSALGNTTVPGNRRRRDAVGAAELDGGQFGLDDLFTPNISDTMQITLFKKINDTFPAAVRICEWHRTRCT